MAAPNPHEYKCQFCKVRVLAGCGNCPTEENRRIMHKFVGIRKIDTSKIATKKMKKYMVWGSKRFRLTKASPLKTVNEADYYATNLGNAGYITHIVYGEIDSSKMVKRVGWLVYARNALRNSDEIPVICTHCSHTMRAPRSWMGRGGYMDKGMQMGCRKCGGRMKRINPWW